MNNNAYSGGSPKTCLVIGVALFLGAFALHGRNSDEDSRNEIKKAVEKCTLDQLGTPPFHLRADLAPSFERDANSGRTGTVEIWWASPTQWKREVRCPIFHQIEIVTNGQEWQHNDGDYFPEWLRETALALIHPIPDIDHALDEAGEGESRNILGTNHVSWQSFSSDGTVKKSVGCGIDISSQGGLLSFASCTGWGGGYADYRKFENRMVARTVTHGSPEVTAKISVVEKFDPTPADFTPPSDLSHSPVIDTVVLDELSFRKNMLSAAAPQWPPVQDGPLEGILTTTDIVIDTNGKIRDIGMILSDNPILSDAARKIIESMQFKPFLLNGLPVQVVSRITMPFKTIRPPGMEAFDSAHNYFEGGRKITSPAFSGGKPYVLHATFSVGIKGKVEQGQYVDTWVADNEWKREATILNSRFARSRNGDKTYMLSDGPDAGICGFVLKAIEPIPAIDTFVESDWRIHRDPLDGVNTIRVLSGYEPQHNVFDPEHTRGYWFDDQGKLLRAFERLDLRYSNFASFNGAQIPQEIRAFQRGQLAVKIEVTEMSALTGEVPAKTFDLPGHAWKRMFTAEAR